MEGFNYNLSAPDAYHKAHPTQPLVGSETASAISTRGVYATDKLRNVLSAYDLNQPGWGETAETWWPFYAARPWMSGGFAWTGFDYRGEPTPYDWPCVNSHFGILDTAGFPKDNFWYWPQVKSITPKKVSFADQYFLRIDLRVSPKVCLLTPDPAPSQVQCASIIARLKPFLAANHPAVTVEDVPR